MTIFRAALLLILCGVGAFVGWSAGGYYIEIPAVKAVIGHNARLVELSRLGFIAIGLLGGGLACGKLIAFVSSVAENLREMPANDKIAIGVGGLIGLLASFLLFPMFNNVPTILRILISGGVMIIMVFLSTQAAMSMREEFRKLLSPATAAAEEKQLMKQAKILDTNIIIDGRIADICRSGFIEGTIYVPGFVLDELQTIADSGDGLKRARGRRGLDILNAMQKEFSLVVRSYDGVLGRDQQEPVDSKLVRLAKAMAATIVTNDFNLNKVAELQGVKVLNVNELANSLKPVVLPGEDLVVHVIKEGKEPGQGIAYLDDGTMVVVENARNHVGDTVGVVVSSVLQTVAGKMIFGQLREVADQEQDLVDRNLRNYYRDRDRPRRDPRDSRSGRPH
jgi:uncharacterized protein YacL